MFFESSEIEAVEIEEGVSRRLLARGGELMMVEVMFEREGIAIPNHSHPHQQVSYILSGAFEVALGDTKETLETGDSLYVAPGVEHGVVPLVAGAVILDVFTPQREDFLES